MKRYLFGAGTGLVLALMVGGCETTSQEYARDAARYQEMAHQAAAAGDYQAAARYQREAERANTRAWQKHAEERYFAESDRQVPVKAMPQPSHLPGP